MIKSLGVVLRYIFPKYWLNTISNFVFQLFSIVFGLFSFTMVMPFLDVLFGKTEILQNPVEFTMSKEALIHNFNYYMGEVVTEYGPASALLYVSLFMLVSVLFKTGFLYAARYVMPPLVSGVVFDIRNDLYIKLLGLPIGYFSDERKGDIMSRMTGDIQEIEASVIRSLDVIFKDPITVIVYFTTLILISPTLTMFVVVMLPLSGLIIGLIGKNLRKNSSLAQNKLGDILSLIEETLGGLKIVKAFKAEGKFKDKFIGENDYYRTKTVKIARRRDLASPLSEYLGTMVVVAVLFFGGSMVLADDNNLTAGALVGFIVIVTQLLTPIKSFSTAYYNVQRGVASIDRINKILDADISIKEIDNPLEIDGFNDAVKYNDVFFKYVDENVLKGVDLEIKKGKTIALVGQSGSGKSTFVDLLPRFYDVTKGNITIDGVDVRNLTISSLRGLLGIVNQESILFNDTIFNNIAFGTIKYTKEQVIEAARIANAHDFILETPNGYETNIGDRGGKLSGGQRQRISIARAILANPPIMILDEATSALDTESEKLVQDSLNNLMKNRTSIVIAHRLSTVAHADLICVLHEGNLVEQGTHEELLKKDGYYKKLHDNQTFV